MPLGIGRRELIAALCGATAWPMAVRARHAERVRRIGILFGGFSEADPEPRARIEAFTRQLHELGWIDGRNVKIDLRFGGGDDNRRRAYAEELIGWMPDVIVANSAPAVIALARQTKAIPMVFTSFLDPVASGLVASLARPGGNITGFSNFEPAMTGKWSFHLQYVSAPVSNAKDVQEAIDVAARESNSILVVIGGTVASANREAIVRLVALRRMPAIYAFRYYVTSGGLPSYSVDAVDLFRRAATYVDRILKGAKAADLPVQRPTKFELVINLKATANEVIE